MNEKQAKAIARIVELTAELSMLSFDLSPPGAPPLFALDDRHLANGSDSSSATTLGGEASEGGQQLTLIRR